MATRVVTSAWQAHLQRVQPGSCVFMLCDVQERFRNMISHYPSVISVGNRMSSIASSLEIPLLVTEHYSKALGPTVEEIDTSRASVFQKTKFSMITPEVNDFLGEERKTAVLYGIEAHVCILQTVLDLRNKGWGVFVVADGTSSSRDWERKIAFERINNIGGVLTTSESILFELLDNKDHPKFKECSSLLRAEQPDSGLSGLV
eukprot:CAMPEP_0201520222 /NCGR_PEP_ID=MMETSP0161_2-20130828/10570_1 /ASSEMBLY_ACC=CAM_ASM_000251 /TAXON_ID=180227 /ORGANISM="Neoparamoeba aestuarina, Strain SoJaBio B1-5/56/2" /LENGTH=202 /DNA_ID=CAMNT_0047918515 /DNA_START=10 /DNA_END=618 /DNA_ORIENTATION=-